MSNHASDNELGRSATGDSVSDTPDKGLPDTSDYQDPKDNRPRAEDREVTHPDAHEDPILLTPPPVAGAEPIEYQGYEPR